MLTIASYVHRVTVNEVRTHSRAGSTDSSDGHVDTAGSQFRNGAQPCGRSGSIIFEEAATTRPFGRVPDVVSLEQASDCARSTALSVIGGVRQALGDLDRIQAWLTVSGFVNAEPGFARTTAVINAFSEVVLDVFGENIGAHARTAIGVSALPLDLPVVVAAELQLRS